MDLFLVLILLLLGRAAALDNGLAKTPPMVRSCWLFMWGSADIAAMPGSPSETMRNVSVLVAGLDVMGALQMRDELHDAS